MPPKTKSKKPAKAKPSGVADGLSTEEMSKDQLEELVICLREALDREREERSFFQLERDKIRGFWEISKTQLEEKKAEIRKRRREREEEEERHRVEMTVYKQKLKHLLSEHNSAAAALKMDALESRSLIQEQHLGAELELLASVQRLQADVREKRHHGQNCTKELELRHHAALMELLHRHGDRKRELELKHQMKLQTLVEAGAVTRVQELQDLDRRMEALVAVVMDDQNYADRLARSERERVQHRRKMVLKTKTTAANNRAELQRLNEALPEAQRERRRLAESLQEAELKLPEVQRRMQRNDAAAASLNRVGVMKAETRALKVEHELLLQAFHKVQLERDELLKKQTEAVLELQQKAGLKELLLEKKMALLTEAVEKNEARLGATLSACSAAGGGGAKHEEILESKEVAIAALRSAVARERQEYDALLLACREKLESLSVPLWDFAFRPSDRLLVGRPSDP